MVRLAAGQVLVSRHQHAGFASLSGATRTLLVLIWTKQALIFTNFFIEKAV